MTEQQDVIDFLMSGAPLGVAPDDVSRIDTHISVVFLAGENAYKLKRARKFPFLDFSTLERRRAACEAELRINRRTAPDVYLGLVPVTRSGDGSFELDGAGETVDWLVQMRRFDGETLFDRMAGRGELTAPLVQELAEEIADFHAEAERDNRADGARRIRKVIDGNRDSLDALPGDLLDPGLVERVDAACKAAAARLAPLLDRRSADGFVRHCHGDLHLRNIMLWDGRPTLFDAIEFDEEIATIDVFYDLAFLLMDLVHRDLPGLATFCFNRYLERSGDRGGIAAAGLFMAVRAVIRAHISGSMAADAEGDKAERRRTEAEDYLRLAARLLQERAPVLVAVGGLSGTGKSTLAQNIAPGLGAPPGAVVLRSDVIRKELAGAAVTERLPESAYGEEMTARVYAALGERAAECLAAGYAVIADAVFARPDQRRDIEDAARAAGALFEGVWLEAPARVLKDRVDARQGDASDADARIVARQLEYDLGAIGWHRVDAGGTPEAVCDRALGALDLAQQQDDALLR